MEGPDPSLRAREIRVATVLFVRLRGYVRRPAPLEGPRPSLRAEQQTVGFSPLGRSRAKLPLLSAAAVVVCCRGFGLQVIRDRGEPLWKVPGQAYSCTRVENSPRLHLIQASSHSGFISFRLHLIHAPGHHRQRIHASQLRPESASRRPDSVVVPVLVVACWTRFRRQWQWQSCSHWRRRRRSRRRSSYVPTLRASCVCWLCPLCFLSCSVFEPCPVVGGRSSSVASVLHLASRMPSCNALHC